MIKSVGIRIRVRKIYMRTPCYMFQYPLNAYFSFTLFLTVPTYYCYYLQENA